jgi:hypothetical protein
MEELLDQVYYDSKGSKEHFGCFGCIFADPHFIWQGYRMIITCKCKEVVMPEIVLGKCGERVTRIYNYGK